DTLPLLSFLHDALPISQIFWQVWSRPSIIAAAEKVVTAGESNYCYMKDGKRQRPCRPSKAGVRLPRSYVQGLGESMQRNWGSLRSEEHTSELQSLADIV